MKKAAVILACVFLLPALSSAEPPAVIITDYSREVRFDGRPVALIQKGDDWNFTNQALDESSWKTVSLPSSWTKGAFPGWDGICWYRIHVRFPPGLPVKTWGVSLGNILHSDEAWFNGRLIGRTGDVLKRKNHPFEVDRVYEIPGHYIREGDNVLAVRIAGFYKGDHGPVKGTFAFGPYENLKFGYYARELSKFIFIAMYVFIGMYFAILFYRRPKQREYLAFSVFSMLFALYFTMRNGLVISAVPFNLLGLEYVSLFLTFPVFTSFILLFFGRSHHWVHYAFYAVTIVFCVVVLAWDDPFVWDWLNRNVVEYTWIVMVVTVYAVLISSFGKNADARKIFFGFSVVLLFVVHDILIDRGIFILPFSSGTGYISQFAFILLDIAIALILANRFAFMTVDVERLNEKLRESIARIEAQNRDIRDAYEKLRELDRMKSDFMTSMSHELRTPLTPIIGFAALVTDDLSRKVLPSLANGDGKAYEAARSAAENMRIVTASAGHLLDLINKILNLTELESGHASWSDECLYPRAVIEDFLMNDLHKYSAAIADKNLRLSVEVGEGLPGFTGDRKRLAEVLDNLVSNAVKFTEKGEIGIGARRHETGVLFYVSDSGCGIPPENREMIFEKFHQLGNVLTEKPEGMGVGLSICRMIVEHYGGLIWVESEVGTGSVFRFVIPSPERECAGV